MVNLKQTVHWTLFALTLAYLITGLGVTYYQAVTALTFGLLSKAVCMRIHDSLIYLFLPALFLHVYLKIRRKR